jgi:hypothetical protein
MMKRVDLTGEKAATNLTTGGSSRASWSVREAFTEKKK